MDQLEMMVSASKELVLRNNWRAGIVLTLMAAIPGLCGAVLVWLNSGDWSFATLAGWGLLLAGFLIAIRQTLWLLTPRLAYRREHLLVYLQGLRPIRVPIDIVECFFLGQGDAMVRNSSIESSTVVVRLAEAAKDWHHMSVKHSLGHWCDGYVTVRGTWCEPLDANLVNHMNSRLACIKRQRRQQIEPNGHD